MTTATATTAGAREHARAQAGTPCDTMPILPATDFPDVPAGIDPATLVWAERVAGGNYTHKVLARGTLLQLTDLTGDACAHVLLYNALEPVERLNVADTQKVQWQVYTDTGQLLLSDQGRVLASVEAATAGRHDSIFGTSTRARNEERYGDGAPHGPSPAGRELFKLAGLKHGLEARDLPPNVSFFQGVRIDADGHPHWEGSAGPGAGITLRIEMPAIVLIANTAHPLDPRPAYHCGPLEVLARRDRPTTDTDPLWSRSPEGRRAYANTLDYLTARGLA
ncbi:urea amidolyase associated protein UAAP1 [Granulicoccus phenolivorans]|uniref:urea amidolyase associated protein UAAP1 n=1 Tax=Granulicoccus phenolivorans TaxID=266854 RepID=UPI000420CB1E|nr:urea amidolyase associated protein UAAP1 [Granulicoccus phenolivorans]